MARNAFIGLIAALLLAVPLRAQDDVPLSDIINYDDPVSETLTDRSFWDWWFIQAAAGDQLVVEMAAGEGLEPLLGILDPGGALVARSTDGTAGGTVTLEYTALETAEYTIVATRVGNENGTSTGPYSLRVRRANEAAVRVNPYQEVIFRCHDYEVANAAVVEFAEDTDQASYYLIAIYGLDGFRPVVRVDFPALNLTDCARDSQSMGGSIFTLPGEGPITLTENFAESAAQLYVPNAAPAGELTLTVGSADGAPGRFIAVIDGFMLGDADRDTIRIGQGPLAAFAPLTLYMVADSKSRLDPALTVADEAEVGTICDDAGRRGCAGVPSPEGLYVYIAEQQIEIKADAFDAGLVLPHGLPELREIALGSFNNHTSGHYAIVLIGELPPRQ